MKRFFKPLLYLFAAGLAVVACKKEKTGAGNAAINVTDYTFNRARKYLWQQF